MKARIRYPVLVLIFLAQQVSTGCLARQTENVPAAESDSGRIRNVIILIGDGMGPQSLGLLISYAKHAPSSMYNTRGRITAIERAVEAGTVGYAYHEAANVLVTDSAASATQMASGKRALSETIGIDEFGNPTETILELAKRNGKSTGLVSDTRITHATPAGFAAHQTHRTKENEIAVDLLNNRVDVMLSGGLRHWIPKEANDPGSGIHRELERRTLGKIRVASKRKDNRNLLAEAEELGYALAFTRGQLERVDGEKMLGLFSYSAMPFRIDLDPNAPERTVPLLREMAAKALDVLSRNEQGFFLMVESGLIDWAAHDNDAGSLLREMIRFDETLACILDWAKGRKDTLLIITADHQTGGFGFSYSRRNIPMPKRFPGTVFKDEAFAPAFNFGSHDLLDRIYKQKQSYQRIMGEFDALPDAQRTAETMADIVNRSLEFSISVEEASAILAREENEYRVEGHKYLSATTFPKVSDFKEYYVYGEEVRRDILGRIVAKQQNVVWSTGTHTNTPVPLIVLGPESIRERFGKIMHTTEWARIAIDALLSK